MSHHHVREVCTCGAVISQCRCMAPKQDRVVYKSCEECKKKEIELLRAMYGDGGFHDDYDGNE